MKAINSQDQTSGGYQPLDQKKRCQCEKWCVIRWSCIFFWLLAFCGAGVGLGFYMGEKFQGNCKAPAIKCGDHLPGQSSMWYNAERDFDFFGQTERYLYSMNFVQNATIPYNDTTVILGTFYSCVTTTGPTQTDKHNCTFNYVYETATCEFNFMNGWCDVNWAVKETDNHLQYVIYNARNDSFTFGYYSHGPSGGNVEFTPSDTPMIECGPANDTVPYKYPF